MRRARAFGVLLAGLALGCGKGAPAQAPRAAPTAPPASRPAPAPAATPADPRKPSPPPADEHDLYVVAAPIPIVRPDLDGGAVLMSAHWRPYRRHCELWVTGARARLEGPRYLEDAAKVLDAHRDDAGLILMWRGPMHHALNVALVGIGRASGIEPFQMVVPPGGLEVGAGDPARLPALRGMELPPVAGVDKLVARPADCCHLWVDTRARSIVAEWPDGEPTAPDFDALGEALLAWGRQRPDPRNKPWSRGIVVVHAHAASSAGVAANLAAHVFQQGIGRIYFAVRRVETIGDGLQEYAEPRQVHDDLGELPAIPEEGDAPVMRARTIPALGWTGSFARVPGAVEVRVEWDPDTPDAHKLRFGNKILGRPDAAGFAALAAACGERWGKGRGLVIRPDTGAPLQVVAECLAVATAIRGSEVRFYDELEPSDLRARAAAVADPEAFQRPEIDAPEIRLPIGRRMIVGLTRGARTFYVDPGSAQPVSADYPAVARRLEQWAVAFRQAGIEHAPTVVLRADKELTWGHVHLTLAGLQMFRLDRVVLQVGLPR